MVESFLPKYAIIPSSPQVKKSLYTHFFLLGLVVLQTIVIIVLFSRCLLGLVLLAIIVSRMPTWFDTAIIVSVGCLLGLLLAIIVSVGCPLGLVMLDK